MTMIFKTRAGQATIAAAERTRFGELLDGLAWRAIERECDPREHDGPSLLRHILPVLPNWVARARRGNFSSNIAMYLRTASAQYRDAIHLPAGGQTTSSVRNIDLNTVIAGYSDQVAFAVGLAAQTPDNTIVEAIDRSWLADLIDTGLSSLVPPDLDTTGASLFTDPGWRVVRDLAADDQDGPIILTHTDVSPFPSRIWIGDDRAEAAYWWNQATEAEKWDASERGLRKHAADFGIPIFLTPDTLHTPAYSPNPDLTWPSVAAAWRTALT